MKNNVEELEMEMEKINEKVKNEMIDETEDSEPIYDGAINEEEYLKSENKILWILKEPYDEGDSKGGGFSMVKDINERPNEYVFGASHKTWQPIIYASYGILNNVGLINDMDDIKDKKSGVINHDMINVLKRIAIINVKKLPGGSTTPDPTPIKEAYAKYKNILLSQIAILNPNIIIEATYMELFRNDFGFVPEEIYAHDTLKYGIKANKLYIFTNHPAVRWSEDEKDEYIDNIINVVRKWLKERNK